MQNSAAVVYAFLTIGLAMLPGCFLPPAPVTPMRTDWHLRDEGHRSGALIVFLPGRHDTPQDFLRNCFVEDLRSAGLDADVVLADAHLGYYYRRSFSERLYLDLIQPARAAGYRSIWVVGVSLGGFGAVMLERDHPGSWDGMILIAPFAGDQKDVLQQVLATSAVQDVVLPQNPTADQYTARFWQWIQAHQHNPDPPIFLGYGQQDRMRREHETLASILPPERVFTIAGGHDWETWSALWQLMLPAIKEELTKQLLLAGLKSDFD